MQVENMKDWLVCDAVEKSNGELSSESGDGVKDVILGMVQIQ